MNREWNTLTHAQRDAVRAVVQRVRETGARADQIFEAGDILPTRILAAASA